MSSEAAATQKVLAELAPVELEVLHLMAAGLDADAIAEHLGIAPHTVERTVRHVIEKLRVDFRLQSVISAVRPDLIEL